VCRNCSATVPQLFLWNGRAGELCLSHLEKGHSTGLLGTAIRRRRSVLRISQEELALRAGIHRTYLSDVERGARNPSIKTIEKIAQALQVPVGKLFEDFRLSSEMK
jgi:DNA-binding XRE family transcriptional regulator